MNTKARMLLCLAFATANGCAVNKPDRPHYVVCLNISIENQIDEHNKTKLCFEVKSVNK